MLSVHAAVLLAFVHCPVAALHVSVVHTLPSLHWALMVHPRPHTQESLMFEFPPVDVAERDDGSLGGDRSGARRVGDEGERRDERERGVDSSSHGILLAQTCRRASGAQSNDRPGDAPTCGAEVGPSRTERWPGLESRLTRGANVGQKALVSHPFSFGGLRVHSFSRSVLALAFVSSLAACAPEGVVEDNDESVADASESLSALGKKLVGSFRYGDGENFYETLTLAKNGTYSGSWKPCPHLAKCAEHLETGKWKAKAPNHLTLTPYNDAGEHYTLSIAGDGSGFKITSASGTTERFLREGASGEPSGPFCGGIAGIQCDGGLTCVLDGDYPDAGGTCTDCPIPSCAPPPRDCHYEAAGGPVTACPSGCGTLVCGPSGA